MSIVIQDLHYAYAGSPALRGVSLTIQAGERVGLIGPNGAGKSTLLLHLNGILATSDRVRVDDLPVVREHLAQVRARVGMVFQDADDQLFMPTVREDVAFGPVNQGLSPVQVRQRVQQALAAVGLVGFEERSSHHLSGGEKRRVSIATVLAMRPSVLVLDEPASSLDARGRRGLVEVLGGLDITVLVATHDLRLVRALCTRAVILDGGLVVADGPTDDLLADHELLRAHGLI